MHMDSDEEGRYQKVRRRILYKNKCQEHCATRPPSWHSTGTDIFIRPHPVSSSRAFTVYPTTIIPPKRDDSRQENAAVGFAASHQRGLILILKSPESATTQFRGYGIPMFEEEAEQNQDDESHYTTIGVWIGSSAPLYGGLG
ncbi:uncharacterized protein EAF01_003041 [Botrytis porri]|uniref:Uncharacterized protein n=1 Tax=Botrytis porri TaxID=87229 RepID=A0A4Z1KT47_9HELO|nr:uncharacterized protein EAF01_003041 [Botrytis porri]KAF7909323.1 hypothetical protein EAF01_003041 [Botrytis porri]TGO86949.1 hypothetical protein BPOR_0264g00070 [Botrytis porri]